MVYLDDLFALYLFPIKEKKKKRKQNNKENNI